MMMSEIIDHRVLPDAIPQSQGTYVNQYGVKRRKTTTRGWGFLIKWKDGSTDWILLKDLKESYPVKLAHYATHKYGIRVPRSIKEAIEIDKENGNMLWIDAIKLEMKNVRIVFEEYDSEFNLLLGCTQITGHIVLDVKLGENFRRKARYETDASASVMYCTVVSETRCGFF